MRPDREARRAEQTLRRLPDRRIIVDDVNDG
jgi:hypothetical protein